VTTLIATIDLENGNALPDGKASDWATSLVSRLKSEAEEVIEVSIGTTTMLTAITYHLIKSDIEDKKVTFKYDGQEIACNGGYPVKYLWKDPQSEMLMELF